MKQQPWLKSNLESASTLHQQMSTLLRSVSGVNQANFSASNSNRNRISHTNSPALAQRGSSGKKS